MSDIYAHIVFINGEVSFQDHNDPIPCWPFTSLNELIDLKEVTDDVSSYFSNLTNGKFLCIVKTAQNFEVYGLYVDHNKSARYEIMTKWISNFTDTDVNCKALRALFNRRLTRFQEIKKRCNVQGNLKMKETMNEFLNSSVALPRQKMQTVSTHSAATNTSTDTHDFHEISSNIFVEENSDRQTVCDNILKERNTLSKSVKIQSTIIKQQTENMKEIKEENFQLKNYLKTQRKELTVLNEISGNEITLRNQIEQVKNRKSELLRKTKLVTELRRKSTFQTKKLGSMAKEIKKLSGVATEALSDLQDNESEMIELKSKLVNNKRELGNAKKKKVHGREKKYRNFTRKYHM